MHETIYTNWVYIKNDNFYHFIKSCKATQHPAVIKAVITWLADKGPILQKYDNCLVTKASEKLFAAKQIQLNFLNGWY